jgi:tRNA (guanine37-N1)-methyltransferase
VDERVAKKIADEEISIGDFVLTGGEVAAMVLVDAVARHIPGVLGKAESLEQESHTKEGFTEYPQYTRPAEFEPEKGKHWKVPSILLSGDHKKIHGWRDEQSSK